MLRAFVLSCVRPAYLNASADERTATRVKCLLIKLIGGTAIAVALMLCVSLSAQERLTTEIEELLESIRAASSPQPDSNAKFKVQVQPHAERSNALGGQMTLGIGDSTFSSIYNEYRLTHWFENGAIYRQERIRFSTPPTQVVSSPFLGIACSLPNVPDILIIGRGLAVGFDMTEIRLVGHTKAPWRLLSYKAGETLLSCSDDGSMRLWDTKHFSRTLGKEIAQFPENPPDKNGGHGEFAAYSPYNHWLATAYKQEITFRDPRTGDKQFSWKTQCEETDRVNCIRFDANGNNLLAFFLDPSNPKEPRKYFQSYDIFSGKSVRFSGTHGIVDGYGTADGNYVVTWDGSSEIVFWDAQNQKEIAAVQVCPKHLYDVAFSPDGHTIVTAGDDDEVKFWRIEDHTRLELDQSFKHEGIASIRFTPNGRRFVTVSDDGWLKTWDAPAFCYEPLGAPKDHIFAKDDPTITEKYSNGLVRVINPVDGTVEERHPDGVVLHYRRQ